MRSFLADEAYGAVSSSQKSPTQRRKSLSSPIGTLSSDKVSKKDDNERIAPDDNPLTGDSVTSGAEIPAEKLSDFREAVVAALMNLEPDTDGDLNDLARKYFMSCDIGREVIIGAVLAAGESFVSRGTRFLPRRPIAKALLRSFKTLGCAVTDQRISFATGMSRKIIRESRQELKEVLPSAIPTNLHESLLWLNKKLDIIINHRFFVAYH